MYFVGHQNQNPIFLHLNVNRQQIVDFRFPQYINSLYQFENSTQLTVHQQKLEVLQQIKTKFLMDFDQFSDELQNEHKKLISRVDQLTEKLNINKIKKRKATEFLNFLTEQKQKIAHEVLELQSIQKLFKDKSLTLKQQDKIPSIHTLPQNSSQTQKAQLPKQPQKVIVPLRTGIMEVGNLQSLLQTFQKQFQSAAQHIQYSKDYQRTALQKLQFLKFRKPTLQYLIERWERKKQLQSQMIGKIGFKKNSKKMKKSDNKKD